MERELGTGGRNKNGDGGEEAGLGPGREAEGGQKGRARGGRYEEDTASFSVALGMNFSSSQNFILIHLGGPESLGWMQPSEPPRTVE